MATRTVRVQHCGLSWELRGNYERKELPGDDGPGFPATFELDLAIANDLVLTDLCNEYYDLATKLEDLACDVCEAAES